MSRRPILFGCAVCSTLLSVAVVFAASREGEWPTFRGTDRSATSPDTGLLATWPESGPELLGTARGAGRGYGTVAIADGKMYTLGDGCSEAPDTDEYLACFDQKTGERLWLTKTGPAWVSGPDAWRSSRSTPTVSGSKVYVVTPQGKLVCCDAASGKEAWAKDLKGDFQGKKGDGWGYSESVLVDGDRLICTPGEAANTMVALKKETGDLVWSCQREGDRGASHASIAISNIGGTKVYVQTTASGPMGVRAEDGKLLWTYDIDRTTAIAPTPIVRADHVFFAAGYRRGGALLKQVPGADGDVRVEEVYPLKSELANKHGGVVLVGDLLFGDSDDQGIPWCADFMTGEVKWKKRGPGKGSASMVAADGHIFVRYANGTMSMIKATAEDHVVEGRFTIPGSGDRPSWSHPVIVDGKLYLRENDAILCYNLRG